MDDDADSSAQPNEAFHKLLTPDIFSEILRHLTAQERLNMRLVSRQTEEAVAQSDMHITGSPQIIYISSGRRTFKVHLGLKKDRKTLKLRQSYDFRNLEEVARVRERLFARVYTQYLDITKINFNKVPVALIERVLEGCLFNELEMKIERANYNSEVLEFLRKLDCNKSRKTKLTLYNVLPDDETLLSLNPMQTLIIKRTDSDVSEEIFLGMVKNRHARLNLPITLTSEQTINDVKKIMEDYIVQQVVKFAVNESAMVKLLANLGYKLIRNGRRGTITNILKIPDTVSSENVRLTKTYYDHGGSWNGGFHLAFEKSSILVKTNYYSGKRYTLEISNFHTDIDSSEEESESDDDF